MKSCPHLQGVILEYFGAYFGILRLLFETRSICFVKFCTDFLGVPFEGHCIIFSISWPSWRTLRGGGGEGGIFGLILGNVYLILHNCSIFSHETLRRCSWYNPDGLYTQKTFDIMLFLWWGSFWCILGSIFAYVHIFSRYPFYILSWNFVQVFLG